MNNIQEKLLRKIKAGEIEMVPKWQFVLRGVLWAAATLVAGLVAVYLLSFIFFILRETGILFAPFLGWGGVVMLIVSSPWILISALGLFLVVLYILVSHYAFCYRKPLVYSMIGVVLFVIGVASIIEQTTFHSRVHTFVEAREVPGFVALYRGFAESRPDEVTVGIVVEVSTSSLMLRSNLHETFQVHISQNTKKPKKFIAEGDRVIVFGQRIDAEIAAFGIRPARPTKVPPPPGSVRGVQMKW